MLSCIVCLGFSASRGTVSIPHAANVHATGEWPYTIAKLVGDKALNTAHGKRHFQLRRVMEAAFLAEPTLQYISRTTEIAEAHCQQWAQLQHFSGEHAVKDFAFQVCLSLCIALPFRWLCAHSLAICRSLTYNFRVTDIYY